jgi:hypothetical protein
MLLSIERTSKLGRIGEALARERMKLKGFDPVINLNDIQPNYPFADVLAKRNGTWYFTGVKARNEQRDIGGLNKEYNIVEVGRAQGKVLIAQGKTVREITALLWDEVQTLATRVRPLTGGYDAVPAWVTVAMRPKEGNYCLFFDLASKVAHRRSIPMKIEDRRNYERLADHEPDARITPNLSNAGE